MNKKRPSFIGAAKGKIGDGIQKRCDIETKRNVALSNRKRVIYVDASYVNGRYQAGVYDIGKNKKITLRLGKTIDASSKAEKCALLYGVLYLFALNKKGMVLSDSKEAVLTLGSRFSSCHSTIAWIPREINLADEVSREKPNMPKKEWRRLRSVVAVAMPELLNKKEDQEDAKDIVLSPCALAMADFIEQEKDFLPATNSKFSNKIVDTMRSIGEEVKSGNVRKIRNEMVKAKIIAIKNNKVVRFMAK